MKFYVTRSSDFKALEPVEKEINSLDELFSWLVEISQPVILAPTKLAELAELPGTIEAEIYDDFRE